MAPDHDERSPLLPISPNANGRDQGDENADAGSREEEVVGFVDGDKENPRNWTKTRKMVNVGIIALMASESVVILFEVFPFLWICDFAILFASM